MASNFDPVPESIPCCPPLRMVFYCQHVLGIGHLFRSIELAKAMERHRVYLVTGGRPVKIDLPSHVQWHPLPGLEMDSDFRKLSPVDPGTSLEAIKEARRRILMSLVQEAEPHYLVVELYPFGRKQFEFELLPVLERINSESPRRTRVVCSLRDILVEKTSQGRYEERVVKILNTYFDALLVHSDPAVITLSETFARVEEVEIPVIYTGFVAPKPAPNSGAVLRERLGLGPGDRLLLASAGSGAVGGALLQAVVQAHALLPSEPRVQLQMFTGPGMPEAEMAKLLQVGTGERSVTIRRFSREFIAFVDAAELAVSMAGYNTCMNLVAAGTPALVHPFGQNREQRLRALRLAKHAAIEVISAADLNVFRLAELLHDRLRRPAPKKKATIALDGAGTSAKVLEELWQRWSGARDAG